MINIILAREIDFNFFYEIKKNKDNMYWSGYSTEPKINILKKFFISTVETQNEISSRKIFIISYKEHKCGYLYFDPIDDIVATVSIAVMDIYSGKGLGKIAMEELVEIASRKGYKRIIAEIREDNVRSKKLFTAIGFIETEQFRLMQIQNINKEVRMIKYVKEL